MLTGIVPIDDLFKRVNETKGIPSGSCVIIGQDEPDDASRFIIYDLIFNVLYMKASKDYKCIYIITDNSPLKIIQEFNQRYKERKERFLTLLTVLSTATEEEKDSFINIIDAQEINEEHRKIVDIDTIQTLQKHMESGRVHIIDYYSNRVKLSIEEENKFVQLRNKKGYHVVNDIISLCEKINSIYDETDHEKEEVVYIYNNSNIIKKELDKMDNASERHIETTALKNTDESNKSKASTNFFLELFHTKGYNMTIFHFFTLGLYESEEKNELIDSADGFIHLRCERDKTTRPLRSIGIRKMKGVLHSSVYNAFRVDYYGIVRLLK